jgi:hypothetical protein
MSNVSMCCVDRYLRDFHSSGIKHGIKHTGTVVVDTTTK